MLPLHPKSSRSLGERLGVCHDRPTPSKIVRQLASSLSKASRPDLASAAKAIGSIESCASPRIVRSVNTPPSWRNVLRIAGPLLEACVEVRQEFWRKGVSRLLQRRLQMPIPIEEVDSRGSGSRFTNAIVIGASRGLGFGLSTELLARVQGGDKLGHWSAGILTVRAE
jgi:hypothetical protein